MRGRAGVYAYMPIDPDSMPSDVATRRAMLAAQAAEMAGQRTELAAVWAGMLQQRSDDRVRPPRPDRRTPVSALGQHR